MKYALTDAEGCVVTVRLVRQRGDSDATAGSIEYDGPSGAVMVVRWRVRASSGFRARRLGDTATAAELAHAMKTSWLLRPLKPRRVV